MHKESTGALTISSWTADCVLGDWKVQLFSDFWMQHTTPQALSSQTTQLSEKHLKLAIFREILNFDLNSSYQNKVTEVLCKKLFKKKLTVAPHLLIQAVTT